MARELYFAGYTFDVADDGKTTVRRGTVVFQCEGDYGTDPVFAEDGEPTGLVKLVPSGRVVTVAEARNLLGR